MIDAASYTERIPMKDLFVSIPTSSALPDGTIHYITQGTGPPLLLLHSAWGSGRFWLPVMGPLSQQFTVFAPDMLGHGDSAKPAPGYSIPEYAKSKLHFMDALRIDKAYLVGNSTGATISIEIAASYSERVNKLVVAGLPVLENDEERAGREATLRATLDDQGSPRPFTLEELKMWFAHPSEELRALANETRSKAGPDLMEVPRAVYAFEVLPRLSQISCPTLILYGEKDGLRGKEHKLLDGIRGSRLVLLPEAGHIPQLDDPEGFVREVLDFLC